MRQFDSFRAITLRANRIDYVSPVVCENEVISSGSGSSSSASAIIPAPVVRKDGPSFLTVSVSAGGMVTLSWPAVTGAYSYAIYVSSMSSGGPFVLQTSNVLGESFSYVSGTGTFWAKATAIEPEYGETFPSPTVEFVVA